MSVLIAWTSQCYVICVHVEQLIYKGWIIDIQCFIKLRIYWIFDYGYSTSDYVTGDACGALMR